MERAPARTALTSVLAAAALVAIKLATGLATGSLALVAEAGHSAADLVAAGLTLFALRMAVRPADRDHPFGHGKAENLAALGEGAFLGVTAALIGERAVRRLADGGGVGLAHAPWYAFAVLGVVLLIDAARARASARGARAHGSPALAANAAHFASDLAGSVAVVVGLAFVAAGEPDADSIAALGVAVLVSWMAWRLLRANVQVLMDAAPGDAEQTVRAAIEAITPPVRLRRLRVRQAAGGYFADVVIGVRADAGVGQGHAVADLVERAVEDALGRADVVVHVEPRDADSLRERVAAAAMSVRGVREIHNVQILEVGGAVEVSLHLKLPAQIELREAHEAASATERAIAGAVPEVGVVHTHIEPLSAPEPALARSRTVDIETRVRELAANGSAGSLLAVRVRETDAGPIAFLTAAMPAECSLTDAHRRATELEQRVRAELPELVDVVVHTEPRA